MVQEKHIIMAIHITRRLQQVTSMQKILTDYGCYIKTRLGLHEASDEFCSTNGIILLELVGNEPAARELQDALEAVAGIDVDTIIFDHEADNMLK
ncbi:MAG: hypothetical protein ACQEQV_10465 [Fibrobacterota bacterium]